MSLASLPNELVSYIVDELPKADNKSLRLANSVFEDATSRRLFSAVYLSKTKRDLATFQAITSNPRLAAIPTRPVWYELTENQNHSLFERVVDEASLNRREPMQPIRSKYAHQIFSMLYDLAAGAFWTESFFTNQGLARYEGSLEPFLIETWKAYPKRRRAAQKSPEQAIGDAVRKLVNLHTLFTKSTRTEQQHGFGAEPLNFFADWNSQFGDDDSGLMPDREVDSDGEGLSASGVPPKTVVPHTEIIEGCTVKRRFVTGITVLPVAMDVGLFI
ncbi:hypothetical protein SCUCBS95973_006610 [Sporothrix curviconia]|uniref:F-box domain-containing protein n=1 Tax=Sporothrix curviconia TaxID=1260050 RepID=A0ABP0C6J8_9PEZI